MIRDKEKKKYPIWAKILLVIITLAIMAGAGYFLKSKYEQSIMRPINTQEIIPGIFAVRNDFVNFYLIQNGESYIAIDAGADSSKTVNELEKFGISPDKVNAVFLTHSHYDHTGALSLFNNATVYTGNSGLSDRFNMSFQTMSDGETVELSNLSIKCIYTPGHTSDSVCFLVDGKYLFVGDTLSLKDGKTGLFNSFYNRDDEEQKASIQALSKIEGVEYIFSAHYGFADGEVFR